MQGNKHLEFILPAAQLLLISLAWMLVHYILVWIVLVLCEQLQLVNYVPVANNNDFVSCGGLSHGNVTAILCCMGISGKSDTQLNLYIEQQW